MTSGPKLARLANHADGRKEVNAKVQVVTLPTGLPALCLFSTRLIKKGEEIRYDYGIKVPWKKVSLHRKVDFNLHNKT